MRSRDILEQLGQRGHDILILTTKCPLKSCHQHKEESNIFRKLHKESPSEGLAEKIFYEYQDIQFVHKALNIFKPDLIYLFHVINLTRTIYPYLADCNIPIVFDEGGKGYSYSYSHRGPWYRFIEHKSNFVVRKMIKSLLVSVINRMSNNLLRKQWKWPENMRVYFNSDMSQKNAQNAGMDVTNCPVIYSGINTKQFLYKPRLELRHPVRIFVPGRIAPNKGTNDAVLLLANLKKYNIDANVTIVGKVFNNIYYKGFQKNIMELGLETDITVLPMLEHDEIIDLYQKSDICFFPSYQLYGLSRVPLEAMSCGCLVITYGKEGSDEIITDKETGFIVPPGDFGTMAKIIQELSDDQNVYRKITCNARKCVEENYTMELYVDRIESFLHEVLSVPRSQN